MPRFLAALHLLAVSVFVGSTLALALALEFFRRRDEDAVALRAQLASPLRLYSPTAIASLGLALLSGAWALTPLKEALGAEFFARVGGPLALKLAAAFLLINSAAYVCFALCHRLVREHQAGKPVDGATLSAFVWRLRLGLWMLIAMAGWTVWLALRIDPSAPLP